MRINRDFALCCHGRVETAGAGTMGIFNGKADWGRRYAVPTAGQARAPCGIGLLQTVQVATARGPVPAGKLRPGDAILTRDSGYRPLVWCGPGRRGAAGRSGRGLITIAPDRLGPGQPARCIGLAPGHGLLVDAAHLLPVLGTREGLAAAAFFGERVAGRPPGGFVHLLLDRHELINADGAWVESLAPEAAFRVFPRRSMALADRLLAASGAPLRPWIEPADLDLSIGGIALRTA